jgi:hypothetical protein
MCKTPSINGTNDAYLCAKHHQLMAQMMLIMVKNNTNLATYCLTKSGLFIMIVDGT